MGCEEGFPLGCDVGNEVGKPVGCPVGIDDVGLEVGCVG